MNFLYNHVIDEIYEEGSIEKYFYDLPFLSVLVDEEKVSTIFIFTEENISELKQIEFIKNKRTGKVNFNLSFVKEEDFSEMDYYDLFEDEKVVGKQLSYEVSIENLNILINKMKTSDINVCAYKIKDKKQFEFNFHRWIYENFKDKVEKLSKESRVFGKEASKEKIRASIKIIAETALKSGSLTFFDMLEPSTLIKKPRDLSKNEKTYLEFNGAKNFIPVRIIEKNEN